MLTVVKNQFKVVLLSVKYNIMREMTNRITFLTNVCFMVLNNATFIVQWLLLFHLKKNIGGYALEDIMVLWGLAASTYGFSHVLFQRAYSISDLIMNGKLDSFLVQPKNVLLSVITSGTSSSAIGDFIYGYLMIIIFSFSLSNLILFTYFTITGALIMTAFAVIAGSISFWIVRGDMLAENMNNTLVHFTTYPDTIFKGVVRYLLYLIVPVGFLVYLPLHAILQFHFMSIIAVTGFTAFLLLLAFFLFYRGLRRYSSSNLMSARI
jgi:ABC-2 type transport system permease protein